MNEQSPANLVEPDGLDECTGGGWGDYPLNSVFVRTEQRTVGDVVNRINNERYVLAPDFQRDFVWSNTKQSKLIESCIMRIPLPVFYVAEAPDGRIIVVDGLQRLTTFTRFLSGDLKLTGFGQVESDGSHQLEGKTYETLPIKLQEHVADTQLIMYILDSNAPERARLDIFERVNSGAVLTRQQMRNALYNGPATEWLKAAAKGEPFQAATAGTLDSKTMRDREAINRFVAFSLIGWQNYKTSDMDRFLADGLKELANCTEEKRDNLRYSFDSAMMLSRRIFGQHAFRKSLASNSIYATRSVINISLFEVSAVVFARLVEASDRERDGELSESELDVLHEVIVDLVKNDEFSRAITYSTNSTQAVTQRFRLLEAAVEKLL